MTDLPTPHDALAYATDARQRAVLFMDVMRQRAEQATLHDAEAVRLELLIDALKRTGPQLDTERLVDALESTRNLDLGLGVPLSFARSDHQASHKIWGTALDETGRFQPIELE